MSSVAEDTLFDAERAAEAGRKSGEARRRRAQLTPEERAKDAVRRKTPDLISELVDAALGKGDFEKLTPKDRVVALVRALEYGLGKPSAMRKDEDDLQDDDDRPTPGVEFHAPEA